jgi:hypothetical protein
MSGNIFRDSHDDELASALREAAPQPPLDDVDWNALQARIRTAAQPALASVGAPSQQVWQPLAGWSPFGIPLAAAATVLLMLGAGALGTRQVEAAADGDVAFMTIEEELIYGLSNAARALMTDPGNDAVIDVALFYDGEDW